MMMTMLTTVLTVLFVGGAVYTDVRHGKICNTFTIPGIVVGLILNALGGLHSFWRSLAGLGVGLGLLGLSCLLGRILGGGDIKLLMAVGALQGPVFLLWTIVYAAIIGGVLAVIIALRHGILLRKLKAVFASCYLRLFCRVPMDFEEGEAAGGPRLPYAIAISLGTVAAIVVLHVY